MTFAVEQKGEPMSVLIKDMEKPKSCYEVIDGEYEYCPFLNTDDDCVILLKKGICEGTWEEQYSKCPLAEQNIIRCKDCKYFHYDKPYVVYDIPVLGHEVCDKWGDGCKTSENGFCFMAERRGASDE